MSNDGYVCHTASVSTNGCAERNRSTDNNRHTVDRARYGGFGVDADLLYAEIGAK
jgi:hypothetical protein